jgi:hypothetical protein
LRRAILLVAMMAVSLLVASGMALAVTKIGTDGPDRLRGTNGDDTLLGKGGNDLLFALGGRETLLGGEGNDYLYGHTGADRIVGGEGDDLIFQGPYPETAKDTLSGGDGNDVLFFDNRTPAKDVVTCGDGFDRVGADRKDVVAPDCEKVFLGRAASRFYFRLEESGFFEDFFSQLARE